MIRIQLLLITTRRLQWPLLGPRLPVAILLTAFWLQTSGAADGLISQLTVTSPASTLVDGFAFLLAIINQQREDQMHPFPLNLHSRNHKQLDQPPIYSAKLEHS